MVKRDLSCLIYHLQHRLNNSLKRKALYLTLTVSFISESAIVAACWLGGSTGVLWSKGTKSFKTAQPNPCITSKPSEFRMNAVNSKRDLSSGISPAFQVMLNVTTDFLLDGTESGTSRTPDIITYVGNVLLWRSTTPLRQSCALAHFCATSRRETLHRYKWVTTSLPLPRNIIQNSLISPLRLFWAAMYSCYFNVFLFI